MTQANDDMVRAAGRPPTGGPVRAPVPQQAGGPPQSPPPYNGPPPQYGYYGPPPRQPYGWRPPPMPLAPDGRPLADFGTRLLAHLIDGAVLTGIAMVVFVPVAVVFLFDRMPELPDPGQAYAPGVAVDFDVAGLLLPLLLLELGFVALLLAGYYFYFVEMMFRSGQTLGKKLMKIKVIPIEPGATLTRGMAAKRYLVEFIVGVFVPLFSYLDGLWQLWDKPYQQTLHDKAAKTVVVKVAP
ncbi:RDD family protein [Actinoplanes sp. NPDC049118]|uniref:RDD family protein n=1 Tax=Actinoplanes sp. NPDC049118 TaxID=3155769 RepID=UPI003403BA20